VLGTKSQGVGQVKVDYIGRAPVDGQDDRFLLASFRPSGKGNLAEDMRMYAAFTGRAVPSAVAVAAAPAVQLPVVAAAPVAAPGAIRPVAAFAPDAGLAPAAFVTPGERPFEQALPAGGVVPVLRPDAAVPLGYQAAARGDDPFAAILEPSPGLKAAMAGLKAKSGGTPPVQIHIADLAARDDASALIAALAPFGRAVVQDDGNGRSVMLEVPQVEADAALKAVWAAGHEGAFALR
jgi:rare lipoprotein A